MSKLIKMEKFILLSMTYIKLHVWLYGSEGLRGWNKHHTRNHMFSFLPSDIFNTYKEVQSWRAKVEVHRGGTKHCTEAIKFSNPSPPYLISTICTKYSALLNLEFCFSSLLLPYCGSHD